MLSLTLVIFLLLLTRKRLHMCAKSIIDNLFLRSFLKVVNSFFCLEMIDSFSSISCLNNYLWHSLYVLEKRLLLATLKLFCWQDCKKSKSASFSCILNLPFQLYIFLWQFHYYNTVIWHLLLIYPLEISNCIILFFHYNI